jgi:hypothetical protein
MAASHERYRYQFYPDGSYAQHSFTYQRFSLQMLCWLVAVRRLRGLSKPADIVSAVRRSVRLLHAVQDERSGYVPNLGSNDGGLPLSLSTCAFRDFRPTLQAASMLVGEGRLYSAGRWDEGALWLAGVSALDIYPVACTRPARLVAPDGGLLMTRKRQVMALLRIAPRWRHRPSQADDAHIDLWIDGTEVAADPGTYRYTAPASWGNRLAASHVHNTVTIGGTDRCPNLGRFLFTAWPRTELLLGANDQNWECWIIESHVPAWKPFNGSHRRLLLRVDSEILVADLVEADAPYVPRAHWNFPPDCDLYFFSEKLRMRGLSWTLDLSAPAEYSWQETIGGDSPEGWHSPTYGLLQPRRRLTLSLPSGDASVVLTRVTSSDTRGDVDKLRSQAAEALRKANRSAVVALVSDLKWSN